MAEIYRRGPYDDQLCNYCNAASSSIGKGLMEDLFFVKPIAQILPQILECDWLWVWYRDHRVHGIRDQLNDAYAICLNYDTTLNSHLQKNTEWGAVTYLSKSKYGKENEEVWINNSSNYITGAAGNSAIASMDVGTTTDYTSAQGVKASTTGTVYGIYDMNGGCWEYVAAYINNSTAMSSKYGNNLVNGDIKTKDVYDITDEDSQEANYENSKIKYGDAIYETSNNYVGDSRGAWYADSPIMPYDNVTFFWRSGHRSGNEAAGLFFFSYGDGSSKYSFRPVLVVV